jgi:tetratricopeptide (TPR) repeat protein
MSTEWQVLLQKLDLSGTRDIVLKVTESLEIIRGLRKSHLRRPDIILRLGPQVESICSDNELWILYEQMFVAALDMKLDNKAEVYLMKLRNEFPTSTRVKRLQGMALEAKGNYDEAIAIYEKLLEENPTNISILQRTVRVHTHCNW